MGWILTRFASCLIIYLEFHIFSHREVHLINRAIALGAMFCDEAIFFDNCRITRTLSWFMALKMAGKRMLRKGTTVPALRWIVSNALPHPEIVDRFLVHGTPRQWIHEISWKRFQTRDAFRRANRWWENLVNLPRLLHHVRSNSVNQEKTQEQPQLSCGKKLAW